MTQGADLEGPALIKGGALREFLLWYEAGRGRGYVDGTVARLSPAQLSELSPERFAMGLLPSTWYSVEIAHACLDSLAEIHGDEGMRTLLREGNAVVVNRMARGLYQLLFKLVGSPELYAKHIQTAWRALHNSGLRAVTIDRPGYAVSTIEGWAGHHPWLCEVTTETMRAVFGAMGCTDIEVERVKCVSRGGSRCEAFVRYRER